MSSEEVRTGTRNEERGWTSSATAHFEKRGEYALTRYGLEGMRFRMPEPCFVRMDMALCKRTLSEFPELRAIRRFSGGGGIAGEWRSMEEEGEQGGRDMMRCYARKTQVRFAITHADLLPIPRIAVISRRIQSTILSHPAIPRNRASCTLGLNRRTRSGSRRGVFGGRGMTSSLSSTRFRRLRARREKRKGKGPIG